MRPVFVASLLVLGACQPRTEIMLGVATDIKVPGIDEVDMIVLNHPSGVPLLQQSWPIGQSELGAAVNLPGSFGVYSPDGSPTAVEVQVAAVKNGQKVVERDAIMTLVSGKTLFVRLGLVASCMSVTDCPAGQTCVEGSCQAQELDTSRLPDFSDDLVTTLTCQSGVNYINTADNSPMPLSSNADQCATGCQEGVCLVPPSGNSSGGGGHAGTCSPAGTYTEMTTCTLSGSLQGCSGTQPTQTTTVTVDPSGNGATNGSGCKVTFDPKLCSLSFTCAQGTSTSNGQITYSPNGFDGQVTTMQNVNGQTCNSSCTITATRTGGSSDVPDAGAGFGGAGGASGGGGGGAGGSSGLPDGGTGSFASPCTQPGASCGGTLVCVPFTSPSGDFCSQSCKNPGAADATCPTGQCNQNSFCTP